MNVKCAEVREGLADLADGRANPVTETHVAGCAACQAKVAELRRSIEMLRSRFHDAPADLISHAKGIFPRPEPVRARLTASTLSAVGARGGDAFQATYEFDGGGCRVMYRPEPEGWTVLGRVEGDGWSVDPGSLDADGRFEFSVADISEAAIYLTRPGSEVVIDAPNPASDDR